MATDNGARDLLKRQWTLLLLGILMVFAQSTAIAPFIYTLF